MIEISSLFTGYGKEDVLHGVNLKCESGKITTIIGPNGCGKSTLLKAVIGLLPAKKGTVTADGIPLNEISDKLRSQKIAYLSQGKNVPEITAERMVLHGRFPYLSYPRKYRKSDYEAARKAMEQMGIAELASTPISQLSGGTRQKVYIAMALCQGADIIMLDEPATYLDISQQMKISLICRDLALQGKTVLTVSHDIISALGNSDSIAVMNEGKIIKEGTPEEIIECGIIPEVFGVDVLSFKDGDSTEYYYRKRTDEK